MVVSDGVGFHCVHAACVVEVLKYLHGRTTQGIAIFEHPSRVSATPCLFCVSGNTSCLRGSTPAGTRLLQLI